MDDDTDSDAEEEYLELLGTEVFVDVPRLKELCRDGIPRKYRGEAWKYLLGIAKPDKAEELTSDRIMQERYTELDKSTCSELNHVRGEISRYRVEIDFFREDTTRNRMERIIVAFLNANPHIDFDPGYIHLLGPFVYSFRKEYEAFYCFSALMRKLDDDSHETYSQRVTSFMGMLRTLHPELYRHIEDEQIPAVRWAVSWLRYLLSRELSLPCTLRLWDLYFAVDDNFALHPFVCTALLDQYAEDLLELDGPEVLGRLQHLGSPHMEAVLAQAYTRRDQVVRMRIL